MFFLLRMTFWLGLVCILLPSGGPSSSGSQAHIDPTKALTVASAAVSDARGFCDRQPQACVAGGQVAAAIGYKAEAGARTIVAFITEKLADKPAEKAPVIDARYAGRPTERSPIVPVSTRGHGTLTGADLVPAYHAPVPLPPRREQRRRPAV